MNNVKSFPPEWNEFDSNNFGKSGGGDNGAETLNLLIFNAVDDQEGYVLLSNGKTSGDIGEAFESNKGRVFIATQFDIYLVTSNPVTTGTGHAFAISAGYVLKSVTGADVDNFNKSGRV